MILPTGIPCLGSNNRPVKNFWSCMQPMFCSKHYNFLCRPGKIASLILCFALTIVLNVQLKITVLATLPYRYHNTAQVPVVTVHTAFRCTVFVEVTQSYTVTPTIGGYPLDKQPSVSAMIFTFIYTYMYFTYMTQAENNIAFS